MYFWFPLFFTIEMELRNLTIEELLNELKIKCTSELGKIFVENIYTSLTKTYNLAIFDIEELNELCSDYNKREKLTPDIIQILSFIKNKRKEQSDYYLVIQNKSANDDDDNLQSPS